MNRNPMTKRAYWHDYRAPGRYMITLSKSPSVPSLSTIEGDWRLPVGTSGSSYTRWSPVGGRIARLIYHIGSIHPALRAEQYVVMPDHVHILLCVKTGLTEHLGLFIARFKTAVNDACGMEHVFEDGFNDQIVSYKRDLNTLFDYIRSNPYRLAVRRANPDFFTRINNLTIGTTTCQAYGNIHLLHNPFIEQVIVHRADAPETLARNRERWLYTAANGGVLVSPFISKPEKTVCSEAEALGGRIILITNETFTERYKPAAHDFELCAQGRLLILSVGGAAKENLSREACLRMNDLAQTIAYSHANKINGYGPEGI